jgi:hypothetical protein
MFQKLENIDRNLRERIAKVALVAQKCNECGIVDWAVRAANDAVMLGRVRDKDLQTLTRLEDTFADDFYRNRVGGNASPLHA